MVWKQPHTCGYTSAEQTISGNIIGYRLYIYMGKPIYPTICFLIIEDGIGVPDYVNVYGVTCRLDFRVPHLRTDVSV